MVRDSILVSVYLLVVAGCAATGASAPKVEQPARAAPASRRLPSGPIALRVFAAGELEVDAGDALSGKSSDEIASEGAGKSAKGGAGVALAGCHPAWGLAWVLTCPAGAVVGAGVAVVGSLGSAVYGGATALSREEMDSARAAFEQSRQGTNLEDAIYTRVAAALHAATDEPISGPGTGHGSMESSSATPVPALMVALDVDRAGLSTTGTSSPKLWLDLQISGGLYRPPATDAVDRRIWQLGTQLGSLRDLTASDGRGLRERLDRAFDAVTAAIVDDLFAPWPARPAESGDSLRDQVVSIRSTAAGERDMVPGAYMLYFAERERSALNVGVPETPATSAASPDRHVAALSALMLSHDREAIEDKAYEARKRAIIGEYRTAFLRTNAEGRPVRVAVLPFTSFPSSDFDAVFYDSIHERVRNSPRLELVYSEYDQDVDKGHAGVEHDLWRGTVTEKHLVTSAVLHAMARVGADAAVLVSYRKRTAGWYGNEFTFSLYIVDRTGEDTLTFEGTELNYEAIIRYAFETLSRRGGAAESVPEQVATVALLPPAFFGPTSPGNSEKELQIYAELRTFMRGDSGLHLSYDYVRSAGADAPDPYDVWTGSAVKKAPDLAKMQALGEAIRVDFLVTVWVMPMWARTEIDVYAFNVATGEMGVGSGSPDRAKELVGSALVQAGATR